MRTIALIAGIVILCGAAAPAKDNRDALTKALDGRIAGTPTNCIDPHLSDGPQIIDNRTILYRETGRRLWRADLPDACPALRPMNTIIVKMYGSQLCRNDTFRVLEPGTTIPSSICRFGKFTPYDKPKGAK